MKEIKQIVPPAHKLNANAQDISDNELEAVVGGRSDITEVEPLYGTTSPTLNVHADVTKDIKKQTFTRFDEQ